jgi:hypothetical protein
MLCCPYNVFYGYFNTRWNESLVCIFWTDFVNSFSQYVNLIVFCVNYLCRELCDTITPYAMSASSNVTTSSLYSMLWSTNVSQISLFLCPITRGGSCALFSCVSMQSLKLWDGFQNSTAPHGEGWNNRNAVQLYSWGAWLEHWPGHRLYWLRFLVIFFSPPKQISRHYLDYATIASFKMRFNLSFKDIPTFDAM